MEKINPDEFRGIAKTLLIPFKYRVEGSLRREAAYRDSMGERFMDTIDFNWSIFSHKPAYWYVVVRTEIIDDVISVFIKNNPSAVIINLGAGLCTRYYRVAINSTIWIEIDLPEVITFRKRLEEPQKENHILISGSVLDFHWMDALKEFTGRPMIFIAEGILMYFYEDQNKKLFNAVNINFPNSEIVFEAISTLLVFLKNAFIEEKFKWGINNIKQIESWSRGAVIFNEWFYNDRHRELLPYTRRLVHRMPLFKNTMKIAKVGFVHKLKYKKEGESV